MTASGAATGMGGENRVAGMLNSFLVRVVEVGKANSREERWPVGVADLTKDSSFGLLRVRAIDPGRPKAALAKSAVAERVGPERRLLFGGHVSGFGFGFGHAGSSLLLG